MFGATQGQGSGALAEFNGTSAWDGEQGASKCRLDAVEPWFSQSHGQARDDQIHAGTDAVSFFLEVLNVVDHGLSGLCILAAYQCCCFGGPRRF
jgi:hypothetical protein